jgi:hypothetical protein
VVPYAKLDFCDSQTNIAGAIFYLGAELVLVWIDIQRFIEHLLHVQRNSIVGFEESQRASVHHDPVLFRLPVPFEEFDTQLCGKTEGGPAIVNTAGGALAHHDLEIGLSSFVVWVVRVVEIRAMEDLLDCFSNSVDVCIDIDTSEFEFHRGM